MADEVLKNETVEETEQEEKKNKLMEWFKSHPKAVFWARLGLWILCAGILPFLFIAWRFELFRTVSKFQVGGWGIIGIVIVAFVALTILKYVKLALSAKYSLTAQCINGICKIIIPLLILLAILICIRDNVASTIKVLGVVIFLELVAIPLNPLPKWAYEMQKDVKDNEKKEAAEYLIEKFFIKKNEHEGGGE